MAEPTPAEELRQAAAKLRETAAKATPGLWTPSDRYPHVVWQGDDPGEQIVSTNLSGRPAEDAAWIALMSPVLAEPLAALLEFCAKSREAAEAAAASVSDDSGRITADEIDQLTPFALPVARAINGTQP